MKVNFNLRNVQNGQTAKDARLIYLVYNFTIEGSKKKFVYSTGFKVVPSHWNDKEQRVKRVLAANEGQRINNFLNDVSTAVNEWCIEQQLKRIPIAPQSFKAFLDEYTGKTQKVAFTLFSFIEQFIADSPTRINRHSNKTITENTIKKYKTTLYHLKLFKLKNRRPNLDFADIDQAFYNQFKDYLTHSCNMRTNTVGKNISVLKTFLSEAESMGLQVNKAYKGKHFETPKADVQNIYLNEWELAQMEKLDLTDNLRLDKVRDQFLIGAWTGQRFSDFSDLGKAQIKDKGNGAYDIHITQLKTSVPVVIPCHSVVIDILKKYDFKPPKAISNQKFNEYLKELAQLMGLTESVQITETVGGKEQTKVYKKWELISSHTGRRSLATNLYKLGVQPKTIMKVTGHKTEKSFYKYIVLSNEEHADIIRDVFEKKVSPLRAAV